MLIRGEYPAFVLVAQPAHAWVSGQLALAWGNDMFPAPAPRADVVLGTVLHDIGWLEWETHPTLNFSSGLPHSFMELPTDTHLDIWEPASRLALPFGRYAALLVSLHGTYLYGFHDYERDTPEQALRAGAFVARETAFQRDVIDSLRADPTTVHDAIDAYIERNRKLVALWDGMSLALCGGGTRDRTFNTILVDGESVELRLTPTADGFTVDPWPLSSTELTIRVDGRRCAQSFRSQAALNAWIVEAPLESFEVRLLPRR